MSKNQMLALKIATVLWVIWGLVHMFAGGAIISQDTSAAIAAVADAIDPELLVNDYHPAAGGLINQHGWNLLWIGLATIIGAVFIWKANLTAIWVTAMVGGLADVGYFLFMDIPGYVHFMPGTVMTMVSASAIILSFSVWIPMRKKIEQPNL